MSESWVKLSSKGHNPGLPWRPASMPLVSLTSKETSARGQKTHVVLCHRAILNRTLCLCHFYEVFAWHRSLKRKPTQSYFCNWRWARMGIVKWDYYLWNEQWKLSLFLPITYCITLQLSMVKTISISEPQPHSTWVWVSVLFFKGLKASRCQSVVVICLAIGRNSKRARTPSFPMYFLCVSRAP